MHTYVHMNVHGHSWPSQGFSNLILKQHVLKPSRDYCVYVRMVFVTVYFADDSVTMQWHLRYFPTIYACMHACLKLVPVEQCISVHCVHVRTYST